MRLRSEEVEGFPARLLRVIAVVMVALATTPARAQTSTWSPPNPGANESFNEPTNWSPMGVPTGTAVFGPTTAVNPLVFSSATLNQIQFGSGAPAYSIGVIGGTLDLVGGGVSNLSGVRQTIIVLPPGILQFDNNSTAGDGTIGYGNRGGAIVFNGNSTAGGGSTPAVIVFDGTSTSGANFENQSNGTITFQGTSTAGTSGIANDFGAATITFRDMSTAGNATIDNTTLAGGGSVIFTDKSNAGSALIENFATNNSITFEGASNASGATIVNANAGNTITFQDTSNAGHATITNSTGSNLNFTASSDAGSSTITNNGTTTFSGSATADQAIITNAGMLNFTATSTAGTSTITNDGTTIFSGSSTANQANIANNATLNFTGASTGGTATITTNSGGSASFFDSSTGGTARFITNAGGTFDMSTLTATGMTAGSIEGAGNYFLGSKQLTTGLNNLSTTVSGVIADGGAAGGAGGSLIKVGTGVLTLSGQNTYSGQTTVSGGTLAAGGVNVFSAASHTVVATGGTLALQGFNQTLNNGLENAGTVELGIPGVTAPGTTLTVAGNYVGNGGTLVLNTFLGADGSPSDKLIINGGMADPSLMRIINVGGPGAETTGNGILVVQTIGGATTASDAFTLAGEVRAGSFDYRLFQGAPANLPDPTVANDWFLRSTFVNGNGGPEEPIGPTPPPEPLPPGVWPIIGPEPATYGVVQPIARQMGLTTLGTFHERVGDAAADAACLNPTFDSVLVTKAPPAPASNCRPAVWGRLFGQQINNHYQAFADPRANGQVAGIQTGVDIWRGSLIPGHSDTAGLYFAYSNGNVSVDGLVTNAAATAYILQRTGSVNLNAYSVGGYWTHYGPTGWYIDAVLQGSFYNGNATTQFASLPTNGTGFTSSLEAGYPIPLPWFGPRFVLEPEGQIIWQRVSFDDANDGLGPVGLGTTSGTSGRLGLRGKWTINDPAGRVWQPYVLANVWRDWGGNATTMFGADPVPLLQQATRLEFAGGVSAKILPGLSLYAQAGYQFAVSGTDGGRRDGVKGDFGVRYAW
jgi:outer membrane autotransporter protein